MHANEIFVLYIQLDKVLRSTERTIYSGIDVISDIGGLFEGLYFFGRIIVGFFTLIVGNPLNAFLTDSLFKSEEFTINDRKKTEIERIASRTKFKSQYFSSLRDRKIKRIHA